MLRVQVQAEFAAPPQHIVGAARPLVVMQVVQFGFEQDGRNFITAFAQQLVDAPVIRTRQPACAFRADPGMVAPDRADDVRFAGTDRSVAGWRGR